MNIQFEENGFYLIKNVLSSSETTELIKATDSILGDTSFKSDLLSIDSIKLTHKILYPFGKHAAFLKYLVHPKMLDVLLNTINNPLEIVPTWEDMLIKLPHCGIPVTYHQDLALQSTKYDIFSFGIYLHSSIHNPVYYLPGSHRYGPLTKTKLYEISEQNLSNFVPILAEPGDMIIHKVKTIHFSHENTTPHPRYTWYLEFRTISQLLDDSPWNKDWILGRRAIFAHALKVYQPDYFKELIRDEELLGPYLKDLEFRIPHETDTVKYDMKSPYNHFTY